MLMRVERVIAELRKLLPKAAVGPAVYALSSWLIDVRMAHVRVFVEYAPGLGLFGISTDGGANGSQEIYLDTAEVAERVKSLSATRQLCSPGKISDAAYAWSKQEVGRRSPEDPSWAEYAAIVGAFERQSVAS